MCRRGFTLLEMLVVIAIIAVLIGLLIPAVQRVRDSAYQTTCRDHLRQVGLALHGYHDAQRSLPPGHSYADGKDPMAHIAWSARLLPYIEQASVWEETVAAFAEEPGFLYKEHQGPRSQTIPMFVCPSDGRVQQAHDFKVFSFAFLSYLGVSGTDQVRRDGVLYSDSRTRLVDITDGTSFTLMLGERPPSADFVYGWWYAGWGQSKDGSADMILGVRERRVHKKFADCPNEVERYRPGDFDTQCDALHFWSPHTGGSHFMTADGAVHKFAYSADAVLPALATRAGGESQSIPD